MHTLEYLYYYTVASTKYENSVTYYFSQYFPFTTSVFVACYNEPVDVLENTIVSIKQMCKRGNGLPYILDDSTDKTAVEDIKELAIKYKVGYIHRDNRRGYKAGALNDALKMVDSKYFAVFDADQKPLQEFLTELTPIMEDNNNLAIIQVPQKYENNVTRVSKGANDIQEVFYNFITEGKSLENSMFSCGSNVLYRTEAIKSVGGFDEKNVTEDMATSIKLHELGYHSIYYNRPLARGEAPQTLNSYFIQQSRWSQGSIGIFFKVLKMLFRRKKLTIGQKTGYFVTTSWYFVGIVNILMIAFPLLFILFNVVSIITPGIYIFIIGFYIIFNFFAFSLSIYSMEKSVYPVLRNMSLTFISSPIFVKSAFFALIGKKTSFKVTPKSDSSKLPLKGIWAQLTIFFITGIGVIYSIFRFISTGSLEYVFNGVFLLYFFILSSTVFYYNK
jgi:cellulose synthase (UDP-forming)